MGMHTDWKSAKTKAKSVNNGKEIKFKQDTGLGTALDKFEAAAKVRAKTSTPGPDWAKLVDAWVKAAKDVNKIGAAYVQELEKMQMNDVARKQLDNFLVFTVLDESGKVIKEGERLETMLKKHRKK